MFEKVKGLSLQGCGFVEERNLDLLKYPFNVVYGRNGSGKSTIAKAFKQIAGVGDVDGEGRLDRAVLYGDEEVELDDEDRGRICVFDQGYIDSNVRVSGEGSRGLKSIVMIGGQVAKDDEINSLEQAKARVEKVVAGLEGELEVSRGDLEKIENRLYNAFKESWSVRDRDIKGNKNRSQVPNDLDKRVGDCGLGVEIGMEVELQREFVDLLGRYRNSLRDSEKIEMRLMGLERVDVEEWQGLLREKFKSKLDEHDHKLIEIMKGMELSKLEEIHRTMGRHDVERCPYCLRVMNGEEKENLCSMIEAVLNREAMEYRLRVERKMEAELCDRVVDYGVVEGRKDFEGLVNSCKLSVEKLNKRLGEMREVVKRRINNLYGEYGDDVTRLEVERCEREVELCIIKINGAIASYNEAIDKQGEHRKRLEKMNLELTYCKTRGMLERRAEIEKQVGELRGELEDKRDVLAVYEGDLAEKRSAKRSVRVALNRINRLLKTVYVDENRMRLVEDEHGNYEIKVRGRSVSPGSVSMGEKNIIALCYFFTDMYEGESDYSSYRQERLVVIDDPVSSFDMDNKMGVMTLMADQFNKIVWNNRGSKILVLSHDLQTSLSMMKFNNKDIRANRKGVSEEVEFQDKLMELVNQRVVPIGNWDGRGKYQRMMDVVYQYVTGEDEEGEDMDMEYEEYLDLTIGNVMRRLVEAYASFNYQKGMDDLFRDEDVLRKLGRSGAEYYRHRTYRFLLNEDSHTELEAKDDTYMGYSKEDRRQTAKDILMFLYMVDSVHIKRYLWRKDRWKTVGKWCLEMGWLEPMEGKLVGGKKIV